MNIRLIYVTILLMAMSETRAALIPHYRMDSFALLSDIIVLCEELDIQPKTVKHVGWTEVKTVVRCRPLRVFKGVLDINSEFTIEYDSIFVRRIYFSDTQTNGKLAPPGRALLFLKKGKDSDSYSIVTAKIIQGDDVMQFGQFLMNPGPLVLAPQKPENIKLPPNQKYSEDQLIEDLLIAVRKADMLQKPVPINASDNQLQFPPIVISVDADSVDSDRIVLNTRSFDFAEAKAWLSNASDRFGRKDPIVLLIGTIDDFAPMKKAAAMAHEFYDDIFFRIPTQDINQPFLFLRFESAEPPITEIQWDIYTK